MTYNQKDHALSVPYSCDQQQTKAGFVNVYTSRGKEIFLNCSF